MITLGLMGGTFDPIHYGHLILGEQAREQFGLDRVLFVTAAEPPHKIGQQLTETKHRFEMVRLAVEGNEHFECSSLDIDRPGPSYTVDTLRSLLSLHSGDAGVYLLMGADEAVTLASWHQPYEIRKMATVVVADRAGGYTSSDVSAALPADLAEGLLFLKMPGVDISATNLRARARDGRSLKYLVPERVEDYILRNGLYRGRV